MNMKLSVLLASFFVSAVAMACPSGESRPNDVCVVGRIPFAVGERVLFPVNADWASGTVIEVNSNDTIRAELDHGGGTFTLETVILGRIGNRPNTLYVAKAVDCHQNFCVGDRIYTLKYGGVGTVREIFTNEMYAPWHWLVIDFDQFRESSIRDMTYVGHTMQKGFRCIENVCANDRVTYDSQFPGTILEVFDSSLYESPKVHVALDGLSGTFVLPFEELGIQLSCLPTKNCSFR